MTNFEGEHSGEPQDPATNDQPPEMQFPPEVVFVHLPSTTEPGWTGGQEIVPDAPESPHNHKRITKYLGTTLVATGLFSTLWFGISSVIDKEAAEENINLMAGSAIVGFAGAGILMLAGRQPKKKRTDK